MFDLQRKTWLFMKGKALQDPTALQVCRSTPTSVIPEDEKRLRIELIREESDELCRAIESNDLLGIADGIGDLCYVTVGTGNTYGIDCEAVMEEIQRANMDKLRPGGGTSPTGKALKPPGWTPPDIEGVLTGQLPIADMMESPAWMDRTKRALTDAGWERYRQQAADFPGEGFTAEHDDKYTFGQLALAAICYALPWGHRLSGRPPMWWPWDKSWWKPRMDSRKAELVKAIALLMAEWERLDRLEDKAAKLEVETDATEAENLA